MQAFGRILQRTGRLSAPANPQKYKSGTGAAGHCVNTSIGGSSDGTMNIHDRPVNIHHFKITGLRWFRYAPSHGRDVSRLCTASAVTDLPVQADGDSISLLNNNFQGFRRQFQIHNKPCLSGSSYRLRIIQIHLLHMNDCRIVGLPLHIQQDTDP